jgi:carbon-monoxide dehydrogenase medium subunit
MHNFIYHRPATLAEARELFIGAEDPLYLAGGQTLIPTLKQRLRQPSDLIDLAGIAELRGINIGAGVVSIAAMTCHADIAASPDVRRALPVLAAMAGDVGDPQVRNRGTIGGALANNDPSADYPAALIALNGTVHTTARAIPADEFFTGLFETALAPDELVVNVAFPQPLRAAYRKFRNPASRYAVVGVCVAETAAGVRVAVTGAGACVFRQAEMEAALSRSFMPGALEGISIPPDDLNADLHASAEYRAHLVGVMAARAVAAIA